MRLLFSESLASKIDVTSTTGSPTERISTKDISTKPISTEETSTKRIPSTNINLPVAVNASVPVTPTVPSSTSDRPGNNFFLIGSMILPEQGIYTHIPKGSYLKVDVKENIQCEYCDIPTLASLSLPIESVTHRSIPYKLSIKHLDSGSYTIS